MNKKKNTKTKQSLTLHQLIVALSYWGTAVRLFLFSFIAVAVLLVALSEAQTPRAVDTEILIAIYVVGSYLLLDFGYVTVARSYVLNKYVDVLALLAADVLLALLYIAPKITVQQEQVAAVDPLMFIVFVPIVVLSIRMLVGLLFGARRV